MRNFVYEALPTRVIFGAGTISRLAEEVARLGMHRPLLLCTPQQRADADSLGAMLGSAVAGVFPEASMHTPVEVTERALSFLRQHNADGMVAIGGGSTTGLGKALALRTGMPHLVVPTTYAGSEMTPILGETKNGLKTTLRDPKVLPQTVIYDVDLTLSLPPAPSATSGMNAIAHAVEALYAPDRNPVVSLMAEEAIASLARALPVIVLSPTDPEARAQALYGAWLGGICLATVGMALHHKLCHTLGGTLDLPHAETHTVVLPHAVAYNAASVPDAMARLSAALGGATDPATALFDLAGRLGAKRSLRELGVSQGDIAHVADLATANPYPNPRPIDRDAIGRLLQRAWMGSPPQA